MGKLEIYKYLPTALLHKDVDKMYMDEFYETVALARCAQELEETRMANAIARVFGEEE